MTSIRFSYLKLLIFKFFKERKEIMNTHKRISALALTASMVLSMLTPGVGGGKTVAAQESVQAAGAY